MQRCRITVTVATKHSILHCSGSAVAINRYDEYGKPAATNIGRFQHSGQMSRHVTARRAVFACLRSFPLERRLIGSGQAPGGAVANTDPAGTSMIRSELVQKLCSDFPDLTQREVENVVSSIFDSITDQLAKGGRVELRGFGAFSTRQRDARVGRNPRTGEAVDVDAKRVPYFKPGKEMRERLNLNEVTAELL